MLIKCDAAQLEWRTKVVLSQDSVALREINNNEDLHSDNQKFFKLPTRTIAKNFLYRMIFADAFGPRGFGGPAYAYANDPDFMHVSSSTKFWEQVVGRFFEKYTGIYDHGIRSIRTAIEHGRIVNPSGRFYDFKQYQRPSGEWDWPRTNILNYPVQGLAADYMTICRKIAARDIKNAEWFNDELILFMSTVHDDIEMDVDNQMELVYNTCIGLENSFTKIPEEFEKEYGSKVNVPLAGECKLGWSLYEDDMVKFKREGFQQIWENVLTKRPVSW